MDLLLDTNAFLWFYQNDPALGKQARRLMADKSNTVYLSLASCWEMAIKYKIGKLTLTEPFDIQISREIKVNAFHLLDVTFAHVEHTISLDMHHRDPFDRLLIAQALVEQIPLISKETLFDKYIGLDRRW